MKLMCVLLFEDTLFDFKEGAYNEALDSTLLEIWSRHLSTINFKPSLSKLSILSYRIFGKDQQWGISLQGHS